MGKTVKLTIRLSPEDMALLKSRTAKTRLSQSGYLRSYGAMSPKPTRREFILKCSRN